MVQIRTEAERRLRLEDARSVATDDVLRPKTDRSRKAIKTFSQLEPYNRFMPFVQIRTDVERRLRQAVDGVQRILAGGFSPN